MALRRLILVSLSCLFVAACGSVVPLENPIGQPPLVEPLEASIGVYYTEHLRNYSCVVEKGYIAAKWPMELGAPSVAMFDTILGAFFEDIEILDVDPMTALPRSEDDFVILDLVAFDGCEARWPIIGTTAIEIVYGATFRSADGDVIEELTVRGRAGPGDVGLARIPRHLADLTEAAMRKAGADFVVKLDENTKLREWLGPQ